MPYYSEVQVKQARNTNILEYMLAKGEHFIKAGKYYRHAEHSSWVYDTKKGFMHFNKGLETDKGIIRSTNNCLTVAMSLYAIPYIQAIKDILGTEARAISQKQIDQFSEKEPFDYRKHIEEAMSAKKAIDYLVNERELDPSIINHLFTRGILAQDTKNNIVFKMLERPSSVALKKLEITGAELRGIVPLSKKQQEIFKRKYFTQTHENSNATDCFHVRFDVTKPVTEVKIFEAPIDLLSYLTIHKENFLQPEFRNKNNLECLAMHGLKFSVVEKYYRNVVQYNKGLTDDRRYFYPQLTLCVDNDEGGRKFTQTFRENMKQLGFSERFVDVKVKDELPKDGKDYNDLLKKMNRQQNAKAKGKQEKAPDNVVQLHTGRER